MRTARRASQSNQGVLPFETSNKHLARANDLGAASGNRTPDLRITSREREVFRAASTPDAVRQVLLSPQMIGP
jgi:hypothetical protein